MIRRIGMWAAAGVVVACWWMLYAWITFPSATTTLFSPLWTFAGWTCPIILAGRHMAIQWHWLPVANAATYALLGLAVEQSSRTIAAVKAC